MSWPGRTLSADRGITQRTPKATEQSPWPFLFQEDDMRWDAREYDSVNIPQFTAGRELILLAEVAEGEHILDVGCGTGALTAELARRASQGEVVGIDPSDEMLARAVENYSQVKNMVLLPLTAQTISFEERFDLVFSNSALQWVREQKNALIRIYRALKKGGRIAFQLPAKNFCPAFSASVKSAIRSGRLENIFETWQSPWYFPTDREYYALLRETGFEDIKTFYREDTVVFSSVNDALRWWGSAGLRPFLDPLTETQREYFRYAFAMNFEESSRTDNGIEFSFRRLFTFGNK